MSLRADLYKHNRQTEIPEGFRTIRDFAEEDRISYDTARKILRDLYHSGLYECKKFPGRLELYYRKIPQD